MPLLEVRDLSKKVADKAILTNVNFQVNKGDFLLIAGQNGSGKTLTMLHIGGLLTPTSGQVLFRGESLKKSKSTHKKVGLVFQEANTQIFCQSVLEEVSFALKQASAKEKEAEAKAERLLKKMSLLHLKDRSPFRLSGGQLKKVTIASIVAQEPEILILDEPFIGLDYPGVQMVLQTLLDLHQQGITIILITHDLEKVLAHATRLLVLQQGRVVYDGDKLQALDKLPNWGIKKPSDPQKASWLL